MSFPSQKIYEERRTAGLVPTGGVAPRDALESICVDPSGLAPDLRRAKIEEGLRLLSQHPLDGAVRSAVRSLCGISDAAPAVLFSAAAHVFAVSRGEEPHKFHEATFSKLLRRAGCAEPEQG